MPRKPTDLMFAAVAGVTALVVISSLAALFSSSRMAGLFQSVVDQNLPARRSAEGLEIALLEQRGFISSYMLSDGDPKWLEELRRRKADFGDWLAAARDTANTSDQIDILNRLGEVYPRYDETRDDVVALYDQGRVDEASLVFLYDLNALNHEAYLLCEEFVAANQRRVDSATAHANRRIRWITWLVLACVGLTIGLGGASLWGFAWGIRAEHARKRHEAQLFAAQGIQEHLLPDTVPELSGLDVHSIWHPAEFAAGDYFDYLHFSDGSLGFVIGDVVGHGIGPALLMASTRAYLRSLLETYTDVGEILTVANSILVRDVGEGRFITLVLVRIDPQLKNLTYVSAGHPTCYVLDASGNVKGRLESTAFPLGVTTDVRFATSDPIPLTQGDVIALFSDGVLEAMCPEGDFFGTERALEVLRDNRTGPAKQMAERLHQAVSRHVRAGIMTDDVTATVIKIEGPPEVPVEPA